MGSYKSSCHVPLSRSKWMVHLAFVDFYNIETVRRIISPWNRILIPPTAYSMFCANVTVWEFFRMVLHAGISKFTNVALNDPYLLRSLFKRDVKHTFKRGLCVQHLVQAQVQKTKTRTTSDLIISKDRSWSLPPLFRQDQDQNYTFHQI